MSHPVNESICFPVQSYQNYSGQKLSNFSFAAIILCAISRYCYKLIISEIFCFTFKPKQKYSYYFSDFEINFLKHKYPKEFAKPQVFSTDFEFYLSGYKKKYCGEITISIEFVNNGTFESSFYDIEIEIKSDRQLSISPFFMSESGLIQHLCEFFSKLWMPIFSQLLGKSYELKENNLRKLSDYISSVLYDSDLSVLNFLNDKFDIILDVFHIVYNFYCLKDGKSSTCLINCDSIMNERGLKKNKSGAGRRGGYKNLERQKIHNALWILNLCGVLIVRELKSYKYVINIPARIYSLPQYIFPKKLVMYNYKSHIWHRRFGFYLIKNKSKHVKVAHLLGTVKNLHSSFKPLQLRDKFENVLDSLCEDGIIHNWHYKSIDENLLCGKNWIKHWKNLVIYVGIINY